MKKFISKKVVALLCMITCILAMTACSSNSTITKITDEANLKTGAESWIETFNECSMKELVEYQATYEANQVDSIANMLESLIAVREEFGDYVSTKDDWAYKFEEGTATVSVTTVHGEREVTFSMTVVPDGKGDLMVTFGKFDPKYSLSELMAGAAANTVIGMGIVFAVLLLMVFIIDCFKYIPAIQEKFTKKNETEKAAEPVVVTPVEEVVEAVEEENLVDDLELVAVIMAAIAAMENTSTDGLVVRSIKRTTNNKWKRS